MNSEHLEIVRRGSDATREWHRTNPDERLDLRDASLSGVQLAGASFVGADLTCADLARADLTGANFAGANLSKSDMQNANLRGANLVRANLNSADLVGANCTGARFNDAHLIGALLIEADLTDAQLRSARLIQANFSITRLDGARLDGSDLTRSSLVGSSAREADLTGANLSRSNLSGTNLSRAKLALANLAEAILDQTTLNDVDLSNALNLDRAIHLGPSSIGVDTLFRSQRNIPDVFLRGCGVPDSIITYLPSLAGAGIEFYSSFISYSRQDEAFTRRLHSRMQQEHLRVWFAPEDIAGGKKLHEQIFDAICVHDKLLLVLSDHSMNSEWVRMEIRRARKRESEEGRQVLFPIRLVPWDKIKAWECFDADSGKDLAVELREYYVPDFSNWKDHDAFEAEFAKLLRDLKKSEAADDKQIGGRPALP